jgi:hypothetical protein
MTASSPSCGPHPAHADVRPARARRDARRRHRHPRVQRPARAASAAAGPGRQLALLARPRLGLATARAQLFRGYPRAEIPRAFAVLRRLRRVRAGRGRRGRPARLHLPVVGHPPAPAPGHRSRCARWTASRRCGRRPA